MASLAPFVVRRGAVYHLRVRIPLDLVAVVGRPEYKRSLKTSCPKVARRRAAKARGRLAEVFEEIRRMRDPREEHVQSLLDMVAEWEEVEDMRRRADAMRTETTALQAAVAELKEPERVGDEIARFSERWKPAVDRLAADKDASEERATLFPALRECLSAFHRENDSAGSGGVAVELGLQLQSLATELQQAENAVASKDAVIEEKDRQLGVQMGTLGAMLANLGIPNPRIHADAKAFAEGREAVFRAKYLAGIDLAAEIRAVREAGVTGYREIADALNARGVPAPRGGLWHPSSVHRQVKRLGMNERAAGHGSMKS